MATLKGQTVVVPRDPHFSHPEHKADEWEVETVCKFFEEKLDFPQYQDDIKALYLNGQSFISLHDDVPFSGFKVAHPLHKVKILSHAERLRNLVIERSTKQEGKQVKHYSAADTAAYLLKNPEVPKITAVLALRHNWCAKNLEKVSKDPKTASKLAPLSDKECGIVIGALCKIVEDNPDLIEKKPEPVVSTAKPAAPQPKAAAPAVVEKPAANPVVPISKVEVKAKPSQPVEPPISNLPEKEPVPEPAIDLSAFEADRKLFMQRISSLEQTLSHHVDDMMKLKQKADKLEQEREIVKAQQSQGSSNSKVAQKIIDSLVQDRQFVTKELEKITGMYYNQIEREKGEVQGKIERLSTEILQSRKQAGSQHDGAGIRVPTMAPSEEFFGGRSSNSNAMYRGGIAPDDDSDLDSVVEHVLSSSAAKGQDPRLLSQKGATTAMTASHDSHRASSDQITTAHGLRKSQSGSVGIADGGPRETVNRTLFVSDEPAPNNFASSSSTANRTLNMAQFIQSNVKMEIDLWQKVLKKYRITGENPPAAVDTPLVLTHAVGDTRQILLEMASKWMSVGRAICTEVLAKDNIEGLQAALMGIRKCSLYAIEAQYSNLFPELFPAAAKAKSKTSKSQIPPKGNIEAMEATFNTFMLAIVTRLFNRFNKNEDKTQLMFLLNQAQAGELPMSEVSRDNFREFMQHQIEMELPWDKFDAAMQRIDVNKSGFITSQEVFSALLKLTPLSERLKPPLGQQVTQLLLTICNDGLVQYHHKMQAQKNEKKDKKTTASAASDSTLSQTWLHLLLARQGSSASFQKYLDTLYSNANGDKAVQESMANLSFMSEKELRLFLESKWVEDQLFVSDILFELSREFVNKAQSVMMDQPQNKHFFNKNKVSAALEYIIKNQQEACSIVAKSLNFYNNLYRNMTVDPGRDVLQELSNFVLDFTEYRVRILECTIRNSNIGLNEEMANILHKKSQQLEQWLLVAVDQPTKLYHDATGALDIKIVEDWRVAELMSVFIPYPSHPEKDASDMSLPCFSSVQSLLELCLVQSVDGMEKYVNDKQHKYADSDALHEVQQEIHRSLWQHNTLTVKPSTLKNTKIPLAGHLVDTINDFNHQQRVDQVTQYLELLNSRAISKKKMLQTLIQLWNATKSLITPASPGKPRRPTASREEIVVQTRALQDRLLEDMQNKPHMKQEQLERRVQNLITAVFSVDRRTNEKIDIEAINRTIMSVLGGTELVDEALVDSLIEVQSLQESLLQANNDAMRLSARILQALKQ